MISYLLLSLLAAVAMFAKMYMINYLIVLHFS